jgi:large subunit ribosomal protein L25
MAVALKIYQRETIELSIEPRPERGKGPVGRLRREQAMLPGVVYGHKQDPVAFKIVARDLERALASGGQNAIFVLIEGSNGKGERAVVREIQYHKVRGDVQHVDFLRIDPDEELTVAVPLTTSGTPEGVRVGGGAVQHSLTYIEMTCIASELPSQVEVDIDDLDIGDSIHVSDLLDQEPRIVTDGAVTIVSVLSPRLTIDEELEAEAEAAAEGEELEEGEEGAEAAEDGEAPAEGEGGGDDAEA